MPQWIDDLRAKAEAATKGPWVRKADDVEVHGESILGTDGSSVWDDPCVELPCFERVEDAEFIAAANPQTVLHMLSLLEWFAANVADWRQDELQEIGYEAGPGQEGT